MAGNPLANMMNGGNPMQAMLNNSPFGRIISVLKSGGDPTPMLNQIPGIGQIFQMANGKSPEQLGEFMRNAAQQRGIDLGQMAQYIGMPPEIAARYGITMNQEQKKD